MARLIILLATFWGTLQGGIAFAADYTIKIRQINPDSYQYTQGCELKNQPCNIFMGINPQNRKLDVGDLELKVSSVIKDEKIFFQFQSLNHSFFISDLENVLDLPFNESVSRKQTVKIYDRSKAAENDPVNDVLVLPVVRPAPEMVAELEIEIEKDDSND